MSKVFTFIIVNNGEEQYYSNKNIYFWKWMYQFYCIIIELIINCFVRCLTSSHYCIALVTYILTSPYPPGIITHLVLEVWPLHPVCLHGIWLKSLDRVWWNEGVIYPSLSEFFKASCSYMECFYCVDYNV